MKDNFQDLRDEIISKALHPNRIFKLMKDYGKNDNLLLIL